MNNRSSRLLTRGCTVEEHNRLWASERQIGARSAPESISLEACRSPCPRLEHTLLRSVEELTVVVDHLLRVRVRVVGVRVRVRT